MVDDSQMSKLGLQHQALVCVMHKNSVDVESDMDTLPPTCLYAYTPAARFLYSPEICAP
jgi:hypothetical protein